MGFVPKWSRGDQKKTSASAPKQGVRQMPSLFHGAKDAQYSGPALFADGGEVDEATLKAEGLKASEGEKVGLWERLKAGNIDEPGSEAYNRFGAGRGRTERDAAAAFKQMDDIEASRKAAPSKAETFPLVDNKVESDAEASQREEGRNAEMTRLMRTTKPVAKPAAPKAEPKAVDWKNAPDESAAETNRLKSANDAIRTKIGSVKARPGPNWPTERSNWDARYGKTHNPDGSPK